MITVKMISTFINEIAPYDTKCEWDNCGLLTGDGDSEVKKIGFALDLTSETLENAKRAGTDLIITHHPIIFKAQKNFLKGNMAFELARIGKCREYEPEEFASFVAERLKTTVRFVDGGKRISSVAVCGGAGMSFIDEVIAAGADAYVTGDISHHEMLDAEEKGLTVVAAGHFETEYPAMAALEKQINKRFPELETVLLHQSNPVRFIG